MELDAIVLGEIRRFVKECKVQAVYAAVLFDLSGLWIIRANDIVDNDAWQHHSCKKCVENEWSGNAKGLGLKTIEPITKEERSSK